MPETTVTAGADTFAIGGDKTVNRLGFGAMRLTGRGIWGPPEDPEEARSVLRRAVELGVNLIDTAEAYGPQVSEQLIAEALHPYPDDLVIATKGGLDRTGPGEWPVNGDPEVLRREIDGSLERLELERIDLWQLHRIDDDVPLDDQLEVVAEARDEGKIGHFGLSEVTVEEINRVRDAVPVATVQNRYNVGDRDADDVVDYCEREGIGFIPWFPLATGDLAQEGSALTAAAERHDATPSQIALAWLLHRSPVMLPIPGTSKVEHLEENMKAARIRLTEAEFVAISDEGASRE